LPPKARDHLTMARPWHAPLLFVCLLATAAAGAWALHIANRDESVRDFQDHQLHTVTTLAAVVQTGLTGASRTLRLLAAATAGEDRRTIDTLLDRERRCEAPPCPSAIAVYDRAATPIASAVRPVALDADQLAAAAAWAGDPANVAGVRTVIARSAMPALVFIVPRGSARGPAGGGFVAEEVPFDSLFAATKTPEDAPYALLVVSNAGDVMYRSGHPEMRLNNIYRRDGRCASCHQSLAHVERMIAIRRGLLQYSVHDTPQLAAVAPVSFEGETWTAAAIAPASGAVGVVTNELRQLGLLGSLTAVGFGVAVHVMWRERRRRQDADLEALRQADVERSHSALTAINATLESAAAEWRRTVDTIDAAILVLDPHGVIKRMNRVAAALLPAPTFSWLGQPSANLAQLPPWDTALSLAFEALERNAVSMARVRVPGTGSTWDLWCRAPERPDHQHAVVVVARDVTAIVELQASLRRSETMAALGLVVAGVAHEVRNPLFAISSLVDAWALQPQASSPRLVTALRHEVQRLKTLMTELLEYGSPSVSELSPHRLAPLVDEAVNACRHEAQAGGVRIAAAVPADIEVRSDPGRLARVFINLLQNAVQHSTRGATVTLSARRVAADPAVEIDVCDDGPGFAAEDLARLFTPFFSRRVGGFGLGLAITERIVGEHGGRLAAANRDTGGAKLTVTLPLGPPHQLPAPLEDACRVEEPNPARR